MVAKEMLSELGHEVVFTDKGESALDAYQERGRRAVRLMSSSST